MSDVVTFVLRGGVSAEKCLFAQKNVFFFDGIIKNIFKILSVVLSGVDLK